MNSDKITFFNLPEENCVIRPALEEKAKKFGLVINPLMEHKIEWSEKHGGRCMCDWNNRMCPCDNISKDLIDYNGSCLCVVLVTKEKLEKINNSKKVNKIKTKENLEIKKLKTKEAKEIAKKIGL